MSSVQDSVEIRVGQPSELFALYAEIPEFAEQELDALEFPGDWMRRPMC